MSDSLKNIVYLTAEQYSKLLQNGTITVGSTTITYSENDLYITPDDYSGAGGGDGIFDHYLQAPYFIAYNEEEKPLASSVSQKGLSLYTNDGTGYYTLYKRKAVEITDDSGYRLIELPKEGGTLITEEKVDSEYVKKTDYDQTYEAPEGSDGIYSALLYGVSYLNNQSFYPATTKATYNTIPIRNADGNFFVGAPNLPSECTPKQYVDNLPSYLVLAEEDKKKWRDMIGISSSSGEGPTLYKHTVIFGFILDDTEVSGFRSDNCSIIFCFYASNDSPLITFSPLEEGGDGTWIVDYNNRAKLSYVPISFEDFEYDKICGGYIGNDDNKNIMFVLQENNYRYAHSGNSKVNNYEYLINAL